MNLDYDVVAAEMNQLLLHILPTFCYKYANDKSFTHSRKYG